MTIFFYNLSWFLYKNWLFRAIMSTLGHIMPNIIAYISSDIMEYPCAKFYTIQSSISNTTNICYFSRFLEGIWLFCRKFAELRLMMLGIINNIFKQFMHNHFAKFYAYAYTNTDVSNILQFLQFLHKYWSFCPKMSHLVHIKQTSIAIVPFNVIENPYAKIYIRSAKRNVTNIFKFLTIFAKNLIFFHILYLFNLTS